MSDVTDRVQETIEERFKIFKFAVVKHQPELMQTLTSDQLKFAYDVLTIITNEEVLALEKACRDPGETFYERPMYHGEHYLVPSTTTGRYCFDDAETGHDLTSGEPLEIFLAGEWISGTVVHSEYPVYHKPASPHFSGLYAVKGHQEQFIGYYFISTSGHHCGLCSGMLVRQR